jgi:SAM-dependent methyltransferase
VVLYGATLFVGAALLFVVQPMAGKMMLPLLGGTPAVWSTCMLFFQAALLGGYAYAHASTGWLGVRRQVVVHLALLLLPFAVLPLNVDPGRMASGQVNPVAAVLLALSASIGLPFVVVSATAPLLQRWFSTSGHTAARDPYFLYSASNLGSMLALLGYPALIEPHVPVRGDGWLTQTWLWSAGYGVLAALIAACALVLWRPATAVSAETPASARPGPVDADSSDPVSWRRRIAWVALAFAPSSLFIGVTTYLTTDIAAVPLLWVLPLALYLLSFIIAFGRWPGAAQRVVAWLAVPVVVVVVFLMLSAMSLPVWSGLLAHLVMLGVVALACHGALAADRPAPEHLTGFYLLISLGGVLGGVFNALVAPVVFTSLAEYPIAMVLAAVLVAASRAGIAWTRRRVLVDAALACGVAALAVALYADGSPARLDMATITRLVSPPGTLPTRGTVQQTVDKLLVYGPPLVAVVFFRRRPLALGLGLALVIAVAGALDTENREQIHRTRSFFGVLKVSRSTDDGAAYTDLSHGTTLHGRQSVDPGRRAEPLSYYYREGPIGQVFADLDDRDGALRVAVIGLGTGTLAAYARPGDTIVFYEIDRAVVDVALDPAYFTYVADARARDAVIRLELGDARLRLAAMRTERPGERYDLIAVDAFSSDAIPVHLLTREALRLYLDMLAPDGLLALHISNRQLRLEPVVANLAEDAGVTALIQSDEGAPESEGAADTTWVVLARTPGPLDALASDERWTAAAAHVDPRVGTWTDDFHNLLAVFKWR